MNVILDCERMKHPYTGLHEYCYQLGLSLQKYMGKDNLCYYLPHNVETIFGANYPQIVQKSIHKLKMPYFDANIFHCTYQTSHYMPKSKKIKKVLTIHDLNFLYEKNGKRKKIDKYLTKVQQNIDRADYLVAISNYVKDDVLENLNVRNKPFDVIHNGCNVLEFEKFNSPIYMPKGKFVFSIGTVLPKKNFHVLPGLLSNNDYELVIAGRLNDEYQTRIKEVAKTFGVEDRVKLLGPVSAENKYWYLNNCSAFMFPSIAEGFGIPVIEAMYFGKPVFLSTLTSLPEVGGKYAYYFQNFEIEHMRETFKNGMEDYMVNNRAKEIKAYADHFRWDRCAEEYYKIYKSLH